MPVYARQIGRLALCLSLSPLPSGCGGAHAEGPSAVPYQPPDFGPVARSRDVSLPDPAEGAEVTLEELLAWAHEHAPDVRIARAALADSEGARADAEPLLPDNPVLTGGAGPRITGAGTGVDIEASLSQAFEIAGERGLRLDVADRVQGRVEAQLAGVHFRVHVQVHAAFHAAQVARERVEATGRLVSFEERLLEIAQRRVAAGDTSPLTVRLAEGEVAQARQLQIAARQEDHAIRVSLAEIAGWPLEHPIEPAGQIEAPRTPPPLSRLLQLAARHQPQLAVAHARREEAAARVVLEDREGWPEPTIGVAWAREGGPNESENVISGTLSIPIPLFQRNQGGRARARAALAMAEAELDVSAGTLQARITRHAGAVRAAAERVAVYGAEILPSFERNLEMLNRAFELGEIDVLQVSVAVERFLGIQSDALEAHADYFEALGALEQAVGADIFADERHEEDDTDLHTEPVQLDPGRGR